MLDDFPLASTILVSGMGGLTAGLTLPSSAVAMLVPRPPGVYGYILIVYLISSAVRFGSSSVRNARAAYSTRVVFDRAT